MKTIVRWHLTGTPERPVSTTSPLDSFRLEAYSLFKHGSISSTRVLAETLCQQIITRCPEIWTAPEIALPVAYLEVPPACYHLVRDIAEMIQMRVAVPVRIVKVDKDTVTGNNYAAASQESRRAELERIRFTVAEPISDDALVIVVDDIKVTGLAEEFILRALRDAGVRESNIVLAYVAAVDASLAAAPHVESIVNHSAVTSILDMVPAIRSFDWRLTVRFLKDILASDDLEVFARRVGPDVVRELLEASHASGPEFEHTYADGIARLETYLAAA